MQPQPEQPALTPRTLEDKSLGELFSDFTRETTTLVRQEAELGRTELIRSAKQAGKDAGLMAGGVGLAHIGLLALVAAAILGLGEAMPYWASALLVGAVLAVIGLAVASYGRKQLKDDELTPKRTIASIKESAQTIKEHERWNPETH